MSAGRVEKRYDLIIKQNNNRLHRCLVLTNKMKVLLISDPTTDKSAAAMNINAGNYILFCLIFLAIFIRTFL